MKTASGELLQRYWWKKGGKRMREEETMRARAAVHPPHPASEPSFTFHAADVRPLPVERESLEYSF